jgi:glycosyltransferase involved in cell wall biosynthesis
VKIVFLSPAGQVGGAERALIDIIASLRSARPDWSFGLIAAAAGELVREARELGAETAVVAFPRALAMLGDAGANKWAGNSRRMVGLMGRLARAAPGVAIYRRQLAHAIRSMSPDLVHSNGFKMHVLGAWATPFKVPVLWHIHDFVRGRPLMAPLLRAQAHRCAAIVANSRSVAADARTALGQRPAIFTVYNAIDLTEFAPTGSVMDLDYLAGMAPLGEGGVRVGIVATMARWKGHETFLRAIAMLPTASPIRAYVIGGPLYETEGSQYTIEELRLIAARMGLRDRVAFTGYLRETAPAMRSLDIVVHASTEPEPFGLVIAEAMACGRAVIVSAGGGASEILENGVDSLAHPPGDAPTLARLIGMLAGDPALRALLGQAATKTSARHFTHGRLAADLLTVYSSITTHAT